MHLAPPPESFGDEFDSHASGLQMTAPSVYDPLDDIFGPDPDPPAHGPNASVFQGNHDISLDTQSLQAQHHTVGYRDGITAGKAGSIQTGFDQGFSLGANIGLKAGQLLGLLEGISAALAEAGDSDHAHKLLSEAAAELNPECIFTSEFWAADGSWVYPVTASHEGGEIIYSDVADQHPLIAKWSRIVRDEADRWQVDQTLPVLEPKGVSERDESAALPETSTKANLSSRDAIQW
ncbi:hypothetical protein F5B22DRAFT_470465 [Xylaria bambusicola]|uniref:uncharacterized protein n=1 Tax=Xylaria bambusicola TaxID=326684 RepID=UPI002007D3E3|nr:uncharacterized protein F5B22DRAFT_470465 [Xylaria bambusicola]KAI0522306.1 hypothetical protein F5B22DRAFT_470465 [Xylaria bambusicola]